MDFINKKIIICVLFFWVFKTLSAQGPYSYNSPLDKRIYSQTAINKLLMINPANFGSEMSGYDGLTILANLEMNLDQQQTLVTFRNNLGEIYMEVFYKDKTLMFRRYYSGTTNYYDYILYDQLFSEQANRRFEFRLYCTSFFIWTQVAVNGGNYLSPVYFGLDAPQRTNMQELIDASPRARIEVGNSANPNSFLVRGLSAYAFHYNDLRQDIYSKFSNPSNSISDDFDAYE